MTQFDYFFAQFNVIDLLQHIADYGRSSLTKLRRIGAGFIVTFKKEMSIVIHVVT